MSEANKEAQAFVGLHSCGRICACAVDSPEHKRDTAKFVAGLIRDGLQVEKMTCEAVRAAQWCSCASEAKAKKTAQVSQGALAFSTEAAK
jgi:hypothetical protein